jgi:hypothetical protein
VNQVVFRSWRSRVAAVGVWFFMRQIPRRLLRLFGSQQAADNDYYVSIQTIAKPLMAYRCERLSHFGTLCVFRAEGDFVIILQQPGSQHEATNLEAGYATAQCRQPATTPFASLEIERPGKGSEIWNLDVFESRHPEFNGARLNLRSREEGRARRVMFAAIDHHQDS